VAGGNIFRIFRKHVPRERAFSGATPPNKATWRRRAAGGRFIAEAEDWCKAKTISKRKRELLECAARIRTRHFRALGSGGYFSNGDHAGLGNELDSIACLETGAAKYAPRNDDLILCFCGHDQ
jgi:hypothetical protein